MIYFNKYLNAYPNAQYVSPPATTSTTFFIMILASFLSETQPDSNIPNPKNIKEIELSFRNFAFYGKFSANFISLEYRS